MPDRFDIGMETRRAVLGDAHVDRAEAATTAFDTDFQRFITEGAWGSVWSRPGLSQRERSLITIALLAALGHDEEVAMHVRATANTGATPDDIKEALLHVAVYAGVPAANRAFKIAKRELGVPAMIPPLGEEGAFYPRDRAWHPPANTPGYKSTTLRAPRHALLSLGQTKSELTGPTFGHGILNPLDNDLIRNFSQDGGEAIGQRMIVYGQVLDENARPVRGTLVEFWQANAGGRYRHKREGYVAALDPNFGGCGRAITDDNGYYHFRTIKPGAYPWPNGGNDWRPAHIHFSVFGHAFAQRLITQMYFEGDPMIWQDPIALSIPDRAAVEQLIARLDRHNTTPMDALAYRFDIVLRGRRSTLFENRPEGN